MIIDDMVMETFLCNLKDKMERVSLNRTSVCVNCSSINSHDFLPHKITITSSISKVTKT